MKSFIKNLMFGKKGVSPTIKSVKPTTNIAGSVSKVKKDAAFKNFKNVQKFKDQKEKGKKMMKEAQKELRRAVETKRATQIGKSIYHRNVPADPADLKNEKSAKSFKIGKGKDLEKKAKGGRVGLKRGTGLMKKSNVQKIKETFGSKQKPQSRMTGKKKFPDLTGDGKVTFADILKGRGVINGKKKKKVI